MPVSIRHLDAILCEPPKLARESVTMMVEWEDTLFYKVTYLHKVHKDRTRAYVSFEDGSSHWVNITDLHMQMNIMGPDEGPDDELIFCCICDSDTSEAPNNIVICDVCEQGYHQECHTPSIKPILLEEGVEFICHTCKQILEQNPDRMVEVGPTRDHHGGGVDEKSRKSMPSAMKTKTAKKKRASELVGLFRQESDESKPTTKRKPLITRIKLPKQSSKAIISSQGGSNGESLSSEQSADSSTDEDNNEAPKSGISLEKIDEPLVESTKKIVDHKEDIISTDEFVHLIAPKDVPNEDSKEASAKTRNICKENISKPSSDIVKNELNLANNGKGNADAPKRTKTARKVIPLVKKIKEAGNQPPPA